MVILPGDIENAAQHIAAKSPVGCKANQLALFIADNTGSGIQFHDLNQAGIISANGHGLLQGSQVIFQGNDFRAAHRNNHTEFDTRNRQN